MIRFAQGVNNMNISLSFLTAVAKGASIKGNHSQETYIKTSVIYSYNLLIRLATGANVINILQYLLSALAKEARIKGNMYALTAVTYIYTTVIYSHNLLI